MRNLLMITIVCLLCAATSMGENTKQPQSLEKRVETLSSSYDAVKKKVGELSDEVAKNKSTVKDLQLQNETLQGDIDSLKKDANLIKNAQTSDRTSFTHMLNNTNRNLESSQSAIKNRTIWGIVAVVVILLLLSATVNVISRKVKKGNFSVDEVRKAQDALQHAQNELQEEAVKLDSKLLEILQRQLSDENKQSVKANAVTDHSLALKVADEIARIEVNMSRMDSTVKGFKQLKSAVRHIKDNFRANGYEIADMLGMPYDEGMRVNADFVIDENLKPGERVITGIIKPQVLYNGQLIQKATIKVSQNI